MKDKKEIIELLKEECNYLRGYQSGVNEIIKRVIESHGFMIEDLEEGK